MKVKVKFFSLHREVVGKNEIEIEVKKGVTADELLKKLIKDYPKLEELKDYTIFSLNHNYANGSEVVKDGDEIALFPPVGGG